MILKTLTHQPTDELTGLLRGLSARGQQVRGPLEAVGLFPARPRARRPYADPVADLAIVEVHDYGSVSLRNRNDELPLIAPMHIGYVQRSAQNHATAQTHVLAPSETLRIEDAFCIQESQGGYLGPGQQRFLMLPASVRHQALSVRGQPDYSRLWSTIDGFTRRYGVTRGGHLERFLRPYFRKLVHLRHCFEPAPGQVGAAWFVGDELLGVEVYANPETLAGMLPILAIYGYGPEAVLHELRHEGEQLIRSLDLLGIRDLDDLAGRLDESRAIDERSRIEPLQDLSEASWEASVEHEREGLQLLTVEHGDWLGQIVRDSEELVYASLVRRHAD